MPDPDKRLALLHALDDQEWRSVSYRLGNFHPWMAHELVKHGLAEERPRERKSGAYVFRRTAAGRAALKAPQTDQEQKCAPHEGYFDASSAP